MGFSAKSQLNKGLFMMLIQPAKTPHLFDLSCLHCAYINKMAYKPEPITH